MVGDSNVMVVKPAQLPNAPRSRRSTQGCFSRTFSDFVDNCWRLLTFVDNPKIQKYKIRGCFLTMNGCSDEVGNSAKRKFSAFRFSSLILFFSELVPESILSPPKVTSY